LNPFVVRDAGEEHGALIATSLGAPLTAEQPHQIVMHGAVIAAEARGQGSEIDLSAVIASRVSAIHAGTRWRQSGLK
jgi:hypothetical protein